MCFSWKNEHVKNLYKKNSKRQKLKLYRNIEDNCLIDETLIYDMELFIIFVLFVLFILISILLLSILDLLLLSRLD